MRSFLLWLSIALLTLPACSQSADNAASEPTAQAEASIASDNESSTRDEAAPAAGAPALSAPASAAPAPNRLLIYHADLRVRVAGLAAATQQLEAAVQAAGGWTSGLTETRENGEWRQQTTIRVVPGQFKALLRQVGGLGIVESKSLSTTDVTAEHADISARLATKRALEQEYLRLLKQAKKMSDLLEVQEKIGEVREEIESTEARLKKLNDEVGFSTITVTLYQPLGLDTPAAPVVSFGARLVEAVYDGWQVLVGLVIGAVTLWPLWLLGAGGWWLVRRWRRK